MRKKQKLLVSLILLAALAVGGSLMGLLDAMRLGVSFFEEKVHEVLIYDEEDLIETADSFYNNIYYLKEDIVINDLSALASRERPFIGTFDGQGHTVTFSGKTADSLFGYIGEGGVVKNLHIQVAGATFDEKMGAILALENAGQILNCKVTLQNSTVSAKGSYGGMVAFNRGIIKNAVADVMMTKRLQAGETENTRLLVTGAICAYNYGEIFSSVATVVYESFPEADRNEVFGTTQNGESYIGAIFGINNRQNGISHCVALVEDSLYSSDQKATGITFALDAEEVFEADRIFFELGFDEELWILRDTSLDLVRGD
ncbi:MAG: hypothetical protein E7666_02240 [Ruminococcaceae bacterium]|nr:hypothetical protein [Oscillospiraceae bacterium]